MKSFQQFTEELTDVTEGLQRVIRQAASLKISDKDRAEAAEKHAQRQGARAAKASREGMAHAIAGQQGGADALQGTVHGLAGQFGFDGGVLGRRNPQWGRVADQAKTFVKGLRRGK